MSTNVGHAEFDVGLDSKGFDSGLRDLERKTARSLDEVGKQFQKVGRDITRVGTGFTVGLTLPIVGAGAAIAKMAGDFEAGLNRVAALSGATGESFERLKVQAKELGISTQFSATEAADAMGFLAMAGFQADQIFAAMPGTLRLAGSAQLDLGRSADIVSNILTGFKLPVDQLDRAVDVLAKTFTTTNTDLSMLGESFKYVGPVATSAGLEFEETAAALGLLANAGLQASTGGTGLRQILISLGSETEVFGIATRTATGELRPLAEFMAEAERRGVSLEEAINAFSVRGGPAFLALLGQGADALSDMTAELQTAGGTAERIQQVQLQGLNGQLKALRSAAEGLAIEFGEAGLVQSFTEMAEKATTLLRRFAALDEGTKQNIMRAGLFLAAIGPITVAVGKTVTAIGGLIRAYGFLRTTMLPFLGPAGIFAAAVAGYFALNRAMDAGRESRAVAQQSFESMVLRMQEYRGELVVTSEAERQAAVEALERQRRVLEITLQNQQAFFNAVQADVVAFANKGFFGQLFSFGAANVDLATLDQLEGQIATLERELSTVNSEIGRVTSLDLTPVNRGLADLPDFDLNAYGALGEEAGSAMAEAAERVFGEGSLGFLYQKLQEANDAFEAATDDAGRAAARVLVERYAEAIKAIESQFEESDVAGPARLWVNRLMDELVLGIKDYGEVFDLLSPRLQELREEAASALQEFGFESEQYRDTVAKLRVIEEALQLIGGRTEGIDITPTIDVSNVARTMQLTAQLSAGTGAGPELLSSFRELQELAPGVARQFFDLARELAAAENAAARVVSSTAALRAEEDIAQAVQPGEGLTYGQQRDQYVDRLTRFLESGTGTVSEQIDAYRELQLYSAGTAAQFADLARELMRIEREARNVVSSTAALRFDEDMLQSQWTGAGGAAPTSAAAQQVQYLADALEAGALPVAQQLAAFRELQQLAPAVAARFSELARELMQNDSAAANVARGMADVRAEEDALQAAWSDPAFDLAAFRAQQIAEGESVLEEARARLLSVTGEAPSATDLFRQELERLMIAFPSAAEGFQALIDSLDEFTERTNQLAADRTAAQGFLNPQSPSQARARELGVSDEDFNKLIDAGLEMVAGFEPIIIDTASNFSDTIASAGVSFAKDVAQAFIDGDPSKAVSGLASFGSTIAQTLLPGIEGVLLGGAIEILGSLLGGLFGGGSKREEEERAMEERRSRSLPSLRIQINVTQNNNYGTSNVDPRVRSDNDRRTREIVLTTLEEVGYPELKNRMVSAS